MEFDLKTVLETLQKRRKIFTSEADFQLELGMAIKKIYRRYNIRMEYTPFFDENMHIDILVITNNNEWIPIELKYKTKGKKNNNYKDNKDNKDSKENKYMSMKDSKGHDFFLKTHGAQNINCYKYINDIKRIEDIKENLKNHKKYSFLEGYTIFITNDKSYMNEPKKGADYEDFSLHNNNSKIYNKELLQWKKHSKDGKSGKNPIQLDGKYLIKWNSTEYLDTGYYSKLKNQEEQFKDLTTFNILINEIN